MAAAGAGLERQYHSRLLRRCYLLEGSDLTAGTTYQARARAKNAQGTGTAWSGTGNATVPTQGSFYRNDTPGQHDVSMALERDASEAALICNFWRNVEYILSVTLGDLGDTSPLRS